MSEAAIEAEIQAKGLNAPRLSPAHIDAQILTENWGRASDLFRNQPTNSALDCLTICVLVLRNGYTVVGKSACASPENYDAELGAKIAREDARKQIWALEGYSLRSQLAARHGGGGSGVSSSASAAAAAGFAPQTAALLKI